MKLITVLVGWLSLTALAAGEDSLNLVSYNIRYAASGDGGARAWTKRQPQVVRYLAESKASIFGLQEALHHQLVAVDEKMPDFKFIGAGRDDGKSKGEFSPIFYDAKKWTPDEKEQGTFWYSDTPEVPGSTSWGNTLPRICTWARFLDADGRALYVYNTHWDHQSQPSREKSAEAVLEKIASRAHKDEPFVLMGDFNATTENAAIKTLLKSGVLRDSGGEEQNTSFNLWKPGLRPGLRIDHIFVSDGLKAGKLEVESNGDPVGSDHHPVILREVKL